MKNLPGFRLEFLNFLIVCFLASSSTLSRAQETTGGLTGKVTDSKNVGLAGATVTAIHTPSGTRYATRANEDGHYSLLNLRIGGPYTLEASLIGMLSQVKNGIQVQLGEAADLNFALQESAKALNEVVVKASKTGPSASSTGAGTNISGSQLREQPSAGRSLQDYTKLTPQYNGNSFQGTNFRYNNVTIDGAINNDAIGFSPSLGGQTGTSGQPGSSTRTNSFSIDAIQDIQVYVAPYDVKIGNFTGGSINAVTRSGTNEVHGSLYVFGRNGTITAPDPVQGSGKLSGFSDAQEGFRLGFPLIKNKLFWFTNEENTVRYDPLTETANTRLAGGQILTADDARAIQQFSLNPLNTGIVPGTTAGFDPGTADGYRIYSKSKKFFNRLDWNVFKGTQLSIRNNYVTSSSTNLTRDEQNFRFSSIDYVQNNRQNASVAELRSQIGSKITNNFIAGYSSIHDYRDPSSYAYYPQIQIGGRTLGTTILLGTDREASLFDLKQKTLEITDNLTIVRKKGTLTIGTHNEFYTITYNFVNSPNGRIDYRTVEDYLLKRPSRIRGSFNYSNTDRSYIFDNPSAQFKVNLYSLYAQDDIRLTDRIRLVPGLRFDLPDVPTKQLLSIKSVEATPDVNFGRSYRYTRPSNIANDYLGRIQISPRLGFNIDLRGDRSLVLRGGTGVFTGRIPFAWLGYAFYNNGNTYGAFDRNNYVYDAIPPQTVNIPNAGTDPQRVSPEGILSSARSENGSGASNSNGQTQIDLIDNHFKMPQVWRSSAALDWLTPGGLKLSLEGIYTKVIYDVKFQNINQKDTASFNQYDRGSQQPIFKNAANDPSLTSLYLLSNTHQGYRYSITAQARKSFPQGLELSASYTYGESKDISNGIRNSLESNWQLNQALNPNNPGLAYSNFDIRDRIVVTAVKRFIYGTGGRHQSVLSLFFNASSGQPFTYGFVNTSIQGTGQQVSLAYIPKGNEYVRFFRSGNIPLINGEIASRSAEEQAQSFYEFVQSVPYLKSREGNFTERNAARTPWNTTADFRFSQQLSFSPRRVHSVTFTWDIINLTNLLYSKWGRAYFVSDLFNSTASVGLRPSNISSVTGYPVYYFEKPASPYQTDSFQSRWQMQFGLRYSF